MQIFDPGKTILIDLAGGTNQVYVGEAKSIQPSPVFTITSVTKANPAVFTIAAHGLSSDNAVTIAGASAGWAPLNGIRNIIVLSANTFSVAVDSTGFAGNFDGTLSTTAPRTSASCWRISRNYYDGGNNLVRSALANGSPADNSIWDNRASLSYQ